MVDDKVVDVDDGVVVVVVIFGGGGGGGGVGGTVKNDIQIFKLLKWKLTYSWNLN